MKNAFGGDVEGGADLDVRFSGAATATRPVDDQQGPSGSRLESPQAASSPTAEEQTGIKVRRTE
jgi:hypothetical protein